MIASGLRTMRCILSVPRGQHATWHEGTRTNQVCVAAPSTPVRGLRHFLISNHSVTVS